MLAGPGGLIHIRLTMVRVAYADCRQCIVDGPGVPSDQVPAKTMKTVTLSSGSSPAITGEPGRLAPQLFTASPETKNIDMGMPAFVIVAQVLLLCHHVAHRSRSQRR